MPFSKWPSDANAASESAEYLAAARASMLDDARRLLSGLYQATSGLGDAFVGAGLATSAWRSPNAQLPALSDQLPDVRLDALLMRLAKFAADTGPRWLAGDGAALDEFAHEVQALASEIGPLRALAQRQRLSPPSARDRLPLEQALRDVRVGTQLDWVARTLRRLAELTPLLEPLPLFPPAAPSWPEPAPMDPGGLSGAQENRAAAPDWLVRMRGEASRWPGSGLLRRVWPPRHARVAWLVAGALVLVVSGALVLAHDQPPSGGTRVLTSAQVTHTRSATPSPTRTAVPPTPVPGPAHLVVSPTSVVLACGGANVTLTVSDTGGQALTWHASVSGNAVLSATSGWVGPRSSGTLDAHARGAQHGPGTIDFTSNGGNGTVTYKVSCH